MKIALVCPYDIDYPGGVTNHVVQFATEARKKGHEVTIIAPTSRRRGSPGFVSVGRPIPVPVKGGTVSRITFSFWNLLKIRRFIRRTRPDVVHVHEPEASLLSLMAVKYADPAKSLIAATFHTNMPHNIFTYAYNSLSRTFGIHKLAQKIVLKIAVSAAAKDFISKYLPGNYLMIPNGIDIVRFSPRSKPFERFMDGKTNILFVGRLGDHEKRKGLEFLIEAFNQIHEKDVNTRLIVVGPGKPGRSARRLLSKAKHGSIVFTGGVSSQELPRYYATADIFCSPATHGESFGLVLAEAMASGKPVVASNIIGYRSVMLADDKSRQGAVQTKAGFLVPPKRPGVLAATLEMLVRNPPLRKRMGAQGRKTIVENFSWEKVAARIIATYKSCMKTDTA